MNRPWLSRNRIVPRSGCHLVLGFAACLAFAPACTSEPAPGETGAKPPPRVPAGGVIRLDGKPLAGAVVTFLPTDERGTLTVADTEEDGSYELTLLTFKGGTAPGPYKVGVSYMATAEGKTMSLSVRSALSTPVELLNAKELLPPKYSNLGQTVLSANVPAEGGTFDFDLEGPLLDLPEAKAPEPETPQAAPGLPGSPGANAQAGQPAEPIQPAEPSK